MRKDVKEAVELADQLTKAFCRGGEPKDNALKMIVAMIVNAKINGNLNEVAILSSLYSLMASHEFTMDKVLANDEKITKSLERDIQAIVGIAKELEAAENKANQHLN